MKMYPEENIIPSCWVILEWINDGEPEYCILAGFRSGGYLGSESWRRSTRLAREEDYGDFFLFKTNSGSTYHCMKDFYGLSPMTTAKLGQLLERYQESHQLKVVPSPLTSPVLPV